MSDPVCGMGACFQCLDQARERSCMPRPAQPLDTDRYDARVVIVGAGPAGLAAAAVIGEQALVIDENAGAGGQIWRCESHRQPRGARLLTHTSVAGARGPRELLAERGGQTLSIRYEQLILCTGARERFLPFPGWTLPMVTGAGGLQAMVKNGLDVRGQRVVVAGSGPLLLAVAAYLRSCDARVLFIAEQATGARVRQFAWSLARQPGKLLQGALLRARLFGVPYQPDAWPLEARKGTVTLVVRGRSRVIECDWLACGFGLVGNTELAAALGCRVDGGEVVVDHWQQSTQEAIWCAGEPTGVGGVELAVVEGRIAGHAALGDRDAAQRWFKARDAANRFRRRMDEAFRLRPELAHLPDDATIVCRCEGVPLERIARYRSWREAKLQTRCGMGRCQGRLCGPAVEFLLGWPAAGVRPPVLPVSVASLAAASRHTAADRPG